MIKGTTTQFKFKLPYVASELLWVTIKVWQPENMHPYLPIIKTLENCDSPLGSTDLYVSLTADETMRFSEERKAKVQLRAQHIQSGTIFGSRPKLFTVYPMGTELPEDTPTIPDTPGSGSGTPGATEDGWIILDGEAIIG